MRTIVLRHFGVIILQGNTMRAKGWSWKLSYYVPVQVIKAILTRVNRDWQSEAIFGESDIYTPKW